MGKTITLTADMWSETGVSMDFATTREAVVPASLPKSTVSAQSTSNPLSVKTVAEYDAFEQTIHGAIAVIRSGTVTKVGSFYYANYVETVDTAKTTVKSIEPYFAFGDAFSIVFDKSVGYNSLVNKTLGAIIQDGDRINGTSSADTIKLTSKAESVRGGAGNDLLDGRGGNDVLRGQTGGDTLYGRTGDDKLGGGAGRDKLHGGAGKDTFFYDAISDSRTIASERDTIYDFSVKDGDRFDFSKIDANTKAAGNQAFSFIGTKAFSGKSGELRFDKKASDTYIYADVNGDKRADLSVHLDDAVSLAKGYFIL